LWLHHALDQNVQSHGSVGILIENILKGEDVAGELVAALQPLDAANIKYVAIYLSAPGKPLTPCSAVG